MPIICGAITVLKKNSYQTIEDTIPMKSKKRLFHQLVQQIKENNINYEGFVGFVDENPFLLLLRDSKKNSLLHHVSAIPEHDSPELLKNILTHLLQSSTKQFLNKRNSSGYTPLLLASAYSLGLAQILIDHGAKVTMFDSSGDTPIIVASSEGNIAVVNKIIQKNKQEAKMVRLRHTDPGRSTEMPSHYSLTPLQAAAGNGHTDIVDLLLSNGADINATRGYTLQTTARHHNLIYNTPLKLAILNLHEATALRLIANKKIKFGKKELGNRNDSMISIAMHAGLVDVVVAMWVKNQKSFHNKKGKIQKDRLPILMKACSLGKFDLITALISTGYPLREHNQNKENALDATIHFLKSCVDTKKQEALDLISMFIDQGLPLSPQSKAFLSTFDDARDRETLYSEG